MKKITRMNLILALMLLSSIAVNIYQWQINEPIPSETPTGRVIFRTIGEDASEMEYYIIDGDGANIRLMGKLSFSGAPSWSNDGRYIAVNCPETTDRICILDFASVIDPSKVPYNLGDRYYPEVIAEIILPTSCSSLILSEYGARDISWSLDGEKLLILCNSQEHENQKICILDWVNETILECQTIDLPFISTAQWSPVSDEFLVVALNNDSGGIYLGTIGSPELKYIYEGFSAAWSPDGEKIALAQGAAVGMVDKNGENFVWLYNINDLFDDPDSGWDPNTSTPILFGRCYSDVEGCSMTWSPSGDYIMIQAADLHGISGLYRLDINSGEMKQLFGAGPYFGDMWDPDWSVEYSD